MKRTIQRSLLAFSLFSAAAMAQTAPAWIQKSPANSPSARSTAMVYDAARNQVVLCGGFDAKGNVLNDTWIWDGATWTQKTFLQNVPQGRGLHAMAYDALKQQVVMFGGLAAGNFVLSDTWVWDGNSWTQVSLQNGPPARLYHSMAYDSARGEVIMFGGAVNAAVLSAPAALGDTWAWNSVGWAQISTQNGPAPRYLNALTYDSAHSQIVMFGGQDVNENPLSDTWVFDGSTWTQKSPQNSPPANPGNQMVYDTAHNQGVLFGGLGFDTNQTWIWDGANWTKEATTPAPSLRNAFGMAYDTTEGQVVLFGGFNASVQLGDTWAWTGATLPPPNSPTITDVISASGFGAYSTVSPGGWIEIYGSNLAPNTQSWADAFTGNDAPTMLNGGSVSIGGQAAFVDYISSTQVDAQLPLNIATGGTLQLTLTNGANTSAPFNVTVNATEPGLLAPTWFKFGGSQYVVAQLLDGTYVLPTGAVAGARPAKPGETIVIYGVGFGPVTPNIPAGQIVTQQNTLTAFDVSFGNAPATVQYDGLAPSLVGVYQFNIKVPNVPDNDLVPLSLTLGGVPGTQTLFTAVHQ